MREKSRMVRATQTDRRTFIKTAGVALASGAWASRPRLARAAARMEGEPFRLRYMLGSCMYGTTALAEILPEVSRSGSEAIDVWPRRHGNQREQVEEMGHGRFRALLERHNVKLGMTTRYDLGPHGLQEEIKVVKKFGGRLIVTGARGGVGKTLKDRVQSFVESMQPHIAVAEQYGVTIGIENHANSLIATPDSIRYLAELAHSPRLGIALAPYHLPQDETQLAKLIEELGPKMVHFYAWEHGKGCHTKLPKEEEMLQMPGYGELDFAPLLAAMKKTNYQGWTEIFMHPVPRGIPILESTAKVTEAINKSRTYLAQCLEKI